MKIILSIVWILLSINMPSQAQAFIKSEIESSLIEDGIARVNSTVFVNQTSTNGVLFSQENTANLSKMHRLVITNEQDYIVSNPFILSTEFSVSDTDKPAEIAVLSVAEPITIFPLIEE